MPLPPWKTVTTWLPRRHPTQPLPCSPSRSPRPQSAAPQKPPRKARTQHRFDSLGVNDQRLSIVFFPAPKDFPLLFSPAMFSALSLFMLLPNRQICVSNGRPDLHSPTGRFSSFFPLLSRIISSLFFSTKSGPFIVYNVHTFFILFLVLFVITFCLISSR